MEWLNWRNEEFHTGSLPFEGLKTSIWLPDFFRICTILVKFIGAKLEEYVGTEHSSMAIELVESLSHQKRKDAHLEVKTKKAEFQALGVEERLERIKQGTAKAKGAWQLRARGKEVTCPSCEGVALVVGGAIRSTTPKDNDGELVQEDVWLPAALACFSCELRLKGHAYVAALGFGDQFVTTDVLDPKDYYDIQFDPSEYYQSEYANE